MTTPSGPAAVPSLAFDPRDVKTFHYVGYAFDPASGRLECRYALGEIHFEEIITFAPTDAGNESEAIDAAARLVFLLAGVSYYKAAAPSVIEIDTGLTIGERELLEAVYLDGMGEFAFRNQLDLSALRIEAPSRRARAASVGSGAGGLLIPFGGGLDSIVTVEGLRSSAPDAALFVVSKEGDRFEAIETAAQLTGLPVIRAERRLDEKILRSRELGFLNGHVPVTGIISAISVMAAMLDGRDGVAMSNEWSASAGNIETGGRLVNHQWSKSLEFEDLFRAVLAESMPGVDYFSWLRPFSELWVSRRFADVSGYRLAFRSCNRAFHIQPEQRLDLWCGHCDKCCFIDLILSPYLGARELRGVFQDVPEPLDNPALLEQFRTLTGLSGEIKPFECVGDVDECRIAALLASGRDDRHHSPILQALREELSPIVHGDAEDLAELLLRPLGPHRIPNRYAPQDLLD
jgi:hypothetical protein